MWYLQPWVATLAGVVIFAGLEALKRWPWFAALGGAFGSWAAEQGVKRARAARADDAELAPQGGGGQ